MQKQPAYPTDKDLEKTRLLGIIEGASARAIFNLTSGAFLVGLLKYIGADDTTLGYILAIPVLAAVIQFLSPIILESLHYRKKIITIGSFIHRFLLSILIGIPFLPVGVSFKLWLSGILFFISYLSVSFVNPAISNFYVSIVPQNIRGRYFGKRESYILVITTVVSLVLGKVLDAFKDAQQELWGHIIIYSVILILTAINCLCFVRMKEVPLTHSKERIKIKEIFTIPLKSKPFSVYFIMSIIWNVAIQIGGAYFGVYQVSDLKMNYTTITLLGMVFSVAYILSASIWGKFADRTSWTITTLLALGVLGLTHFLWFITFENSSWVVPIITIASISGGIAWSGVNVALFNLQFDYSPAEKRTVYIGFNAAVSGVIGYLAAIVGAQLVKAFGGNPVTFLSIHFNIKQILFLISSVLLITCTLYVYVFMRKKPNFKQ